MRESGRMVIREPLVNENMPLSWRKETKPHRFCPGCGHGIALKALGEVVDELGILDQVLYGCDIGCSLLSWDFFNFDSIQTHHGRTIPQLSAPNGPVRRRSASLIWVTVGVMPSAPNIWSTPRSGGSRLRRSSPIILYTR